MSRSQKPVMLIRVCFLFFLFLTAVFYWRCASRNDKNAAKGPLLSPHCIGDRESEAVNNEFSNPVKVTINGYDSHAMEPFITRDGSYLLFNSLNDSRDTSLYYATKVDDATFKFVGEIAGVNGKPPHLDAVPSMDMEGRFYFISTRYYSHDYINVFSGNFLHGRVLDLDSQPGNFYIKSPGWIVMDAEGSPDGQRLYYVNAHFSGGSVPDRSDIGIARFSNGYFNMLANLPQIMKNINTEDFLEYAPSISSDGLELFYTRLNPCNRQPEIAVAKRNAASEPFGKPERIGALSGFVEAPSLTLDRKTLYYHRKDEEVFSIYKVSR